MEQLKDLKLKATESLEVFLEISNLAASKLKEEAVSGIKTLAYAQSFTAGSAVNSLNKTLDKIRDSYSYLQDEPTISRVKVRDENGVEETFYFCRTTPVALKGNNKLSGYRSPIGKLASAYVGDDVPIQINSKSKVYEVVEKISFTPMLRNLNWDSINTEFYLGFDTPPKSINSLQEFIKPVKKTVNEGLLEQMLAEDEISKLIVDGIRHEAIKTMSLRDKPILDKFQDEIFRLPIDSQLLIVGPPGTGKTTTLIRRLGQKLDNMGLADDEKALIGKAISNTGLGHESSWLMFTPTDLLKQYVKEAFNREKIPASNENIKTWDYHRKHIARNVMGLLKTGSSNGRYILKESSVFLSDDVIHSPEEWFSSFSKFHDLRVVATIQASVELLLKFRDESMVVDIADYLTTVISKYSKPISLFTALFNSETKIAPYLNELKEYSDKEIKNTLNLLLNTEGKSFFSEFSKFIETLGADSSSNEDESIVDDDDEEIDSVSTPLSKSVQQYSRFIKALARNKYQNRNFSKSSKNIEIERWLAGNLPEDSLLINIGKSLVLQSALRKFINNAKRYISEIPTSYREFRKSNDTCTSFYVRMPVKGNEISPFELDAVILLELKKTRELLKVGFVASNIDAAKFSNIKAITGLFRNQILVDEATDFSIIQLSCMFNLADPSMQSFFACGDFNQRITKWGCRSKEQILWITNKIKMKSINIIYRQSRLLNDFSNSLMDLMELSSDDSAALIEFNTHVGYSPVMAEGLTLVEDVSIWLFKRIKEINPTVDVMPSIAILVNEESAIQPLAKELNEHLQELSLNAVSCPDGKVIGEDNDVRVFSVEHIKGLEFEAVFFIGIDGLAKISPELFDKYLYVGATRAATYLGITAETELPVKLTPVRSKFVESWQ